ncbi:MAG: hypothetical protein ACXAB7_11710, partial [Candidatus Kariarchaeaceae archaeon]
MKQPFGSLFLKKKFNLIILEQFRMSYPIRSDMISVILGSIAFYLIFRSPYLDLLAQLTIYIGLALPILGSSLNIVLRLMKKEFATFTRRLNIFVMFSMLLNICGMIFGTIYASNLDFKIYIPNPFFENINLNVFPLFSYHTLLAFLFLLLITNTMSKVENSLVVFIGVIIFIVAMGGQFLVAVIDLIFPPKLQELIPYIDAFRTLILNIGQVLADPQRIEAEQALASLGNMSDKVDEIGEGYALRKSIGQGIDFGLSAVVIALGMLTFLIGTGIPPGLVILFFGTLSIAFATFSGLFG